MSLNIKNITKNEEIVDFISTSISLPLKKGKKVLLFVSGGSAIPYEVEVINKIKNFPHDNLVITLADERYGLPNNPDSNWFKLKQAGFNLPNSKMIPYLTGLSFSETISNIKLELKEEFNKSEYKIAILGIGLDGHTAGILPHTEAVYSQEDICYFETNTFNRITITPKIISMLDEVIVIVFGRDKWSILKSLEKDISIYDQPAQILKKVPILTIISDYKK